MFYKVQSKFHRSSVLCVALRSFQNFWAYRASFPRFQTAVRTYVRGLGTNNQPSSKNSQKHGQTEPFVSFPSLFIRF
ncbi:hypothetical protein EMCRGX_G002589 [Ephydatia muelleri]